MIPAASSKRKRRCPLSSESTLSTMPRSMREYAWDPIPVSRKRSRTSRSRQGFLLMKYSLCPFRKVRRPTAISVYSTGNTPRLLNIVSETSAMPSGFRCAEPVKMTSSSVSPRRWRMFCSPRTQRIASTMLVLPLPFGPTTAVMPGPKSTRTRCGKDLKPWMSSRDRNKGLPLRLRVALRAFDQSVLDQPFGVRARVGFGGKMAHEHPIPISARHGRLEPCVQFPVAERLDDLLDLRFGAERRHVHAEREERVVRRSRHVHRRGRDAGAEGGHVQLLGRRH